MKDSIFSHFFFILTGCLFLGNPSFCQKNKRPNFVFILTDDQSYGMMGCTGNKVVQTPNLDLLASKSVLFTNAHITSAICTPSRASILLSEYERKHGINFNSGTSMDTSAWNDTYPMVMRRNGYYTGWIGKNHVPVGEGGYKSGVMEKSFDYWFAGHGHLKFYPKEVHDIFSKATSHTQAEIIDEAVVDFLSNQQKLEGAIKFINKRPKNQPFLLTVCFNLPHGAGTSTMKKKKSDDEIYKSKYRDLDIQMPDLYVAKKDIKQPKLPPNILRASDRQTIYDFVDNPETNKERLIRQYQAMTGIDRMVGSLLKKLTNEGLDDNTVIIFLSDHGLFMGEFGIGGKALCYEKTTHVPLMIYNPIAKNLKSGLRSNGLAQSIDIAPTILKTAGIDIPDSYQGVDLTFHLQDQSRSIREFLFTENLWSTQFGNPRCEAVQDKRWKYIRYYQNNTFSSSKKIATALELGINVNHILYRTHDLDIAVYRDYIESPLNWEKVVYEELYDLQSDPLETTNLIDQINYQDELNRMKKAWFLQLKNARGKGKPRVLRYTFESEAENSSIIEPK